MCRQRSMECSLRRKGKHTQAPIRTTLATVWDGAVGRFGLGQSRQAGTRRRQQRQRRRGRTLPWRSSVGFGPPRQPSFPRAVGLALALALAAAATLAVPQRDRRWCRRPVDRVHGTRNLALITPTRARAPLLALVVKVDLGEQVEEGEADELAQHPRAPVARRRVHVLDRRKRQRVHNVHHELRDLQQRNVRLPRHRDVQRVGGKVAVHEDVDERVEDDQHPMVQHPGLVVRPEQPKHCGVVPELNEADTLLLQQQEESVDQLVILRDVEHVKPHRQRVVW
mmetsp:Transcript_26498/g.85288  ORF Transcript_26498/g.85288 Transcript_26498/m.85288 type:complete len:281 (+) Transcript_26498:504-1346(+)